MPALRASLARGCDAKKRSPTSRDVCGDTPSFISSIGTHVTDTLVVLTKKLLLKAYEFERKLERESSETTSADPKIVTEVTKRVSKENAETQAKLLAKHNARKHQRKLTST